MLDNSICFKEIFEKKAWVDIMTSMPTSNTFTSWSWGEYKGRIGWGVHRLSVYDSRTNSIIGCFQLQKKKLGLVTILLVQGGIHLNELSYTQYYETLQSFLLTYVTNKKLTVVIINHQAGWSQDVELGLLRSAFSPVINSSMYTYVIDGINGALSGEALSKNWRHNLKRALNNKQMSVKWIDGSLERMQAIDRLEKFYVKLTNRKSFAGSINFDLIRDIIIEDEDFKIVEASLNNEVIATRVGFVCNDHVLDFLAASSEAAKNTYANYLLLWELIGIARIKGKLFFDCGGINPAENMGVFNFKKGLGGRLVINGPIWLNGSSPIVKRFARFLLSLKT